MKKNFVWVVIGTSESGDAYISSAFKKKPSKKKLSKLVHDWDGSDNKLGSGYDGSYVNINIQKIELEG